LLGKKCPENCKKLEKISGNIGGTGSINNLFAECYMLRDINDLTFNFNKVTSANWALDRCMSATTPMLRKVLVACGESLTSIEGICHVVAVEGHSVTLGSANDTTRTIPANLFDKNPNLSSARHAFDNSKYTHIPGELFDPCKNKITNLQACFFRMSELTTVSPNLLKNKPNLANVNALFGTDSKLESFIDSDPNIFENSKNITNTSEMFSSLTKEYSFLWNMWRISHMFFL